MGSYTLFRSDGCTVTGTLVDGKVDGSVTVAYSTGVVKSVCTYALNVPVGDHVFYDENGDLEMTRTFEDGVVVMENGEPVDIPEEPQEEAL